jgi:hypothetical protein
VPSSLITSQNSPSPKSGTLLLAAEASRAACAPPGADLLPALALLPCGASAEGELKQPPICERGRVRTARGGG